MRWVLKTQGTYWTGDNQAVWRVPKNLATFLGSKEAALDARRRILRIWTHLRQEDVRIVRLVKKRERWQAAAQLLKEEVEKTERTQAAERERIAQWLDAWARLNRMAKETIQNYDRTRYVDGMLLVLEQVAERLRKNDLTPTWTWDPHRS